MNEIEFWLAIPWIFADDVNVDDDEKIFKFKYHIVCVCVCVIEEIFCEG